MVREIDEVWVTAAIDRYRQIERLRADFEAAVRIQEVTVHSPDNLVEVVVGADGAIRKVTILGSLTGRTSGELSAAIEAAMAAADDAARWARRTLHAEMFGGFPPLETFGGVPPLEA